MSTFICRHWRIALHLLIVWFIVGALRLNNASYYDISNSYDFFSHAQNVNHILASGTLPDFSSYRYQVHQPPLYYILSASLIRLAYQSGMERAWDIIPYALFIISMLWATIVALFVWLALKPLPFFVAPIVACVVLLFPAQTRMNTMFNNDLPAVIFMTLGFMALWQISRLRRWHDKSLWLRASLFGALAISFKNTAISFVAVYVTFAGCVALEFVFRHQLSTLMKFIKISGLGLVIILLAWMPNAWHSGRYVDDVLNLVPDRLSFSEMVDWRFFTTFDTTIFAYPFAFGPGENSFWSMQYVTLHNDYFNHWSNSANTSVVGEAQVITGHRAPIPLSRYYNALTLQYLAIPITLVMIWGGVVSLSRTIRYPRRALRDGSLLTTLIIVATQGAQLSFFVALPYVQASVIHARYQGFLYGWLFIIGIYWIGRRPYPWRFRIMIACLVASIAYTYIATRLMWLPAPIISP